MAEAHVEYVGFTATDSTREYSLRVRHPAGQTTDFTLVIRNEAFVSRRARYQDGPDICFLKLQREVLLFSGLKLPETRLDVTDADLEEYRAAHAPRVAQRRPKAPQPA
ncbi:MAG TPA: hypothetical protein VFM88_21335 [Vicinamibacteria bacterium]|nr:hypothetical protein [Vicinamibacteria bacterium]